MARCMPRGAARERSEVVAAAVAAVPARNAAAAAGAGAAGVADSKRNFVYGLHAVNAALERAPERVLELWIVETRDDARTRDLKGRAERVGVHVHSVSGDALAKLVGDVAHQGAAVAMRPLQAWDEHALTE